MVGRKPVLSLEKVQMVRESVARRRAEPTIAQWAARLGVAKETLRSAVNGSRKNFRVQ